MWDIVRELVATGVTVFLTTQYLEEADRLANRIALLDGGRLVAQGTPAELKRLVPGGHVRLEFESMAALDRAALALPGGTRDDAGIALQMPNDGGVHSLRAVLARLEARQHRGRCALGPFRRSRRRVPVAHRPARGCRRSDRRPERPP